MPLEILHVPNFDASEVRLSGNHSALPHRKAFYFDASEVRLSGEDIVAALNQSHVFRCL